ncbi:MAG TPA: 1-phosphofructokinase family hexose kinase [Pyrinomonadaceae bacterium]|jgi:tagatose 6-phosphate kinase
MILIVNLNLAVDHIVEVDELRAGGVQRSRGERRQAGGKGVNVARVLKTLGEPSLLLGFLGGRAGRLIKAGLREEEIASRFTRVENESRTCLIINDRSRREQTVINAPGASISDANWRSFEASYKRSLPAAGYVVITGSLPPDLPDQTYARLIEAAHARGKRVLLDCAGASLRHALEARPFLVKINGAEASELLGLPVVTEFDGAARAARKLRESGAESASITLGAQGALFDFGAAQYRFSAPQVEAVNSVGSGDATLAGLAAGLCRGWTVQESGALAIAAGAANALHGAGACSLEEILELQPRVRCEVENF